jgi:hypothetical protein
MVSRMIKHLVETSAVHASAYEPHRKSSAKPEIVRTARICHVKT